MTKADKSKIYKGFAQTVLEQFLITSLPYACILRQINCTLIELGTVVMDIWVPLLSAALGAGAGLAAALLTILTQGRRLEREIAFQREKLDREMAEQRKAFEAHFGIERSVEAAVHHYLSIVKLPYRSFPMIRHHMGGFDSNELRRHLVRSGAVRFMAADGTELWALRERVPEQYRMGRWKHPEAPLNKELEKELFPGAFDDDREF